MEAAPRKHRRLWLMAVLVLTAFVLLFEVLGLRGPDFQTELVSHGLLVEQSYKTESAGIRLRAFESAFQSRLARSCRPGERTIDDG